MHAATNYCTEAIYYFSRSSSSLPEVTNRKRTTVSCCHCSVIKSLACREDMIYGVTTVNGTYLTAHQASEQGRSVGVSQLSVFFSVKTP
eukprot:scaffold53217_cov52-Attheya_sp.AAC.8